MGYERMNSRNNLYLLGEPTDRYNHLHYADFMAPFTGIIALDFYTDFLSYLDQNRTTQIDYILEQCSGLIPGIEDMDSSQWTVYGLAWATLHHSHFGPSELDLWSDVFNAEDTWLDILTMTKSDFENLLNARDYVSSSNRIGGPSSLHWGTQPKMTHPDSPTSSQRQKFWRNAYGVGCNDGGHIGPYYPLNHQCSRENDLAIDDSGIRGKLSSKADTYQEWGRRVLAVGCRSIIVDGNTMAHVEVDDCIDATITSNKLFWGAFNPSYVRGNHSILVHGDVNHVNVSDNQCGGSIWIKDNYNWGEYGDQNTAYSSGTTHTSAMVNNNVVGHKRWCGQYGTSYKSSTTTQAELFGGVAPTWNSDDQIVDEDGKTFTPYTTKYFYGGGGCIVIDNCTRLTAMGNDCDSLMGGMPDRWFDQIMDGGEWGEIYVNRLGNPYYKEGVDGGAGQFHRQNFQTVITNNKAAGVMGWVRQPSGYGHSGSLKRALKSGTGYNIYAPHIVDYDVASGESSERDKSHLLDRVIPCIGASFGQWSGNRLTSDAWVYATTTTASNIISTAGKDARWFCEASFTSLNWWGNMDSWTGPAQANGAMNEAVPTCTGSKWFGNPNYYVAKTPITELSLSPGSLTLGSQNFFDAYDLP